MPRPVLADPVMPTITPCVVSDAGSSATTVPLRWGGGVDLRRGEAVGDGWQCTTSGSGGQANEPTHLVVCAGTHRIAWPPSVGAVWDVAHPLQQEPMSARLVVVVEAAREVLRLVDAGVDVLAVLALGLVVDEVAELVEAVRDLVLMEIIEIGAVHLDSELNATGELRSFVRPVVEPTLSAVCAGADGSGDQPTPAHPRSPRPLPRLGEVWRHRPTPRSTR